MKRTLFLLTAVVLIPILLSVLTSCGSKPPKVQLVEGRLRACPDTPNCVSSESTESSARIAPLNFQGPSEIAWKILKETVRELGGTIQKEQKDYLWATFTSRIFRFVDDVEFRMVAAKGVIHVRSASRLGYSDLGVNRKRVDKLRAAFDRKMKVRN